VEIVGPQYFDYETLLKTGFQKYPSEYVQEQIKNHTEKAQRGGKYEQRNFKGINYIAKKSEDRIRILRIEELITDPEYMIDLLGQSNDFRYNELEICGLWTLTQYTEKIELYISKVLIPSLVLAKNGIDLRSILGYYTVSIKRWPEYWLTELKTTYGSIFEAEACLGYIVDTLGEKHLEDVKDILKLDKINIPLGKDEFFINLHAEFEIYNKRKEPITWDSFLLNPNIWTTGGSAPE
jgi:hypothetical protein